MIDTSRARSQILARIREAQGKPVDGSHDRSGDGLARVQAYLLAHPRGPQQHLAADPIAQFSECALRLSSTVERLSALAHVPRAAATYLQAAGLAPVLVVTEDLQALDWTGAGIKPELRLIDDADLSAITCAYAGIAETGTLAFLSSRITPASTNLLPENHLVVVYERHIVPAMEDVFDRIRTEFGELPRALNFVSGPSRTGDIEQTIVLGAHGPYRVHILLISG